MPRVTPGAKTQEAAQKVAESDKPTPKHTTEDYVPDEAQQPSEPVVETKKAPARRAPAAKKLAETRDEDTGEFVFTPLDEADDFLILVMYGPEGTQKTTGACRMTMTRDVGRVLVMAAESGLKREALRSHGVDVSRVVYWPPRGKQVSYDAMERLFYKLEGDLRADPSSWLGVSWDSLTEIIQTLVDQAVQADIDRLTEIAKKAGKTIDIRKVYDRDGTDYQKVTGQFRQLLRKFRSLPCHQVFVALEEDRQESVETEDGRVRKASITGPSLPPKIRGDVMQHADVVIRTSVVDLPGVGPVGIGRANPAEDLRAKDRYGVIPSPLVDPSFNRIWDYVTGKLTAETDNFQNNQPPIGEVAVESKGEKEARVAVVREEQKANRQAGRTATKAKPVTAASGTDDDPPV